MAETHFLGALKQRRADYLGDLQAIWAEIAALEVREDEAVSLLGHVDALLRVEAPDLDLEGVRPRKRRGPHPRAQVGTSDGERRVPVTKAVLRLLRTERVGMTVGEVVDRLRASDYPDMDDGKLTRNVRLFLSAKKSAGVLTSNDERPLRYAVAA